MTQEIRTRLDQMNLVDKFLFDETMEIPEVYEAMLSILMEKQIHLLSRTETEKEFRVSPELREIRLDVVSMDYANKMDTCLILVAPFDIFGKNLYRYTFIGTCQECPDLKLEDGAIRIFINTKGKNKQDFSQEFLDFMKYITESTDEVAEHSKSERIKRIHARVKEIKKTEKMGVKAMQRWEEEAYAREEGFIDGTIKILVDLVKEGILTYANAAQRAGMTEDEFRIQMKQLV